MNRLLKIGLVQYSPIWENKSQSIKKIENLLTSDESLDLLIFPEMTLTGFTMKSDNFAEELHGETNLFFSTLAK